MASTANGASFVYLIAGANATAGEYGITGALTPGFAYLVAGNGTAGLVSDPGGSATPVATDNPVSPTSVAIDSSGNIVIGGSFGTGGGAVSATQVVAKSTGTFYGASMTSGDLYTVAGVGFLNPMPSYAIAYPVGIGAYGVAVDAQGNIVLGSAGEVYLINEQSTPVTRHGTTVPAKTAQLVAGSAGSTTVCTPPNSLPAQGGEAATSRFRTRPLTPAGISISGTTRHTTRTAKVTAVSGSCRRRVAPSLARA